MDFYPLEDGDSQKTLEQGNNRRRFKGWKCSPLREAEEDVHRRKAKWRQGGCCNGPNGRMMAVPLEIERRVGI